MGYYSDVALCLTKNGMDQLKTALAEAEKPPPTTLQQSKCSSVANPTKSMKAQAQLSFCGKEKSGTMNLLK